MTSPANNCDSISSYVNYGLNGIGTAGIHILNKGGTVANYTLLGSGGGWFTRAGSRIGAFQGFASGVYHLVVHKPASTYIANNEGTGANNIKPNTALFLKLVLEIAEVAIPILITYNFGSEVIDFVTSKLGEESFFIWLIGSEGTKEYSIFSGFFVSSWISWWRG